MVIFNDICAYIVGIFFGRTPLIQLSPKKTWEGFVGGIVGTQFLTFVTVKYLVKFNYLICPEYEIRLIPYVFDITCVADPIYTDQIPFEFFGMFTIYLTQFEIHAAIISLFASFIAPFGGFFGSGLKRALKIKDFSNLIPEHGGCTDRFDC